MKYIYILCVYIDDNAIIILLGGIFAALANIMSIAVGASPTQSAFIYFLAADVTLLISFVLYLALSSTVRNLKH